MVEGNPPLSGLRVTILNAGYCTCPEHFAIRGGQWRHIQFPAMFALLEHPRFGPMLFDTGYSFRFFEETRRFPNRLYRLITPVTLLEEQLAVNQLQARGIRPRDITRGFISHFHADHTAALGDFPRARFTYFPSAYAAVAHTSGLKALSRAFIPALIPPDFLERAAPVLPAQQGPLPPEYAPFKHGFDLLGDGSLLGVELPGHAIGQMGLIARSASQDVYFFVADAAWLGRSIQLNQPPHLITDLFFSQPSAYRATLQQLHSLQLNQPGLRLIPSHCAAVIAACQTAQES